MKKFFSLVLALVMALSLTTVAWGALTGAGTVDAPYVAASQEDLNAAVAAGGNITLKAGTYTFPAISTLCTIDCEDGVVFEGKSSLNIAGSTVNGATFSNSSDRVATGTINGIFNDCDFIGGYDALRYCYAGETVEFHNCVIQGARYGVHFDGGTNDVLFDNCTISGFNAFGSALTNLTLDGCTFQAVEGNNYNGINLWGDTVITDCTFIFDDTAGTQWVDMCGDNKTLTITDSVVTDGTNETSLLDVVGDYGEGNNATVDGALLGAVAKVGAVEFKDLQAAIVAAAPSGTVEIVDDVTVDEWKMFAKTMTHADIITCNIDGLTINGNGHTLTVNSIVSGGNGGYLFYSAEKLNINNLTITYGTGVNGGISLKAGTLDNVTFDGGNGVLPGTGDVTINECVFNTTGQAIYYEEARPNLEITDNTFNVDPAANVIILRGGETFTENEVNSGRTVNIKNDTTTVSGNTFNTRVKLYEEGQELSGNSFGPNGYIELEDGVTDADVSGNYWGGGAPTAAQLGGATAKTYYTTAINGVLGGLTGTASAPAAAAKGAYFTANMANLSVHPDCDLDNYKYELKKPYTTGSDAAKTFTQVAIWETHKISGASQPIIVAVVAASADSANLAFVSGSTVTYLNTNETQWDIKATAVKTVDFEDVDDCGQKFTKDDVAAYIDGNNKLYVEDAAGDVVANVGGKLVILSAATSDATTYTLEGLDGVTNANLTANVVYTVKHDYAADTKMVAGEEEVTKVYCKECKKSFSFVVGGPADAIDEFGAGNYTDTGLDDANDDNIYVALKGVSVGSTGIPSTDKVTSAETFDAGIAMYVGMSVMAAAGSAVVIGKKKD